MSPESRKLIDKKILAKFKQFEKNFTEKSEPVFLNEMGKKLTLKKIHQIESVGDKPVSMIAVTRHRYDINEFPKYEKYVKEYGHKRIYYGLWPDQKENKVEYDVLYAIPTNNYEEVQRHLNSHNHMNGGNTQAMALVIFTDGSSEIIKNLKLF